MPDGPCEIFYINKGFKMSSKLDPDHQLSQFLRDYCPSAPPPSLDLEAQILQRITDESPHARPQHPPRRWLSAALVLGGVLLGGGMTWRWQSQTALIAPTAGVLEAFLEDSWSGSVGATEEIMGTETPLPGRSPTQEWWPLTEAVAESW